MLGDAGKAAAANFTQDRILAREVAENRGLADFQNPDNILNARVLVTLLAKKPDGGFNDLLAQLYFLAFTKTEHFPADSLVCPRRAFLKGCSPAPLGTDRKSTRLNSSHGYISYAVFCLKKKNKKTRQSLNRILR